LMQQILDAACDGSVAMRTVFATDRKRLDTYTIDPAANWFDPSNERADAVRKVARGLLKGMQSPKMQKQQVDAALDVLDMLAGQAPGPRYRWIGWLSRDAEGKFLMRFSGHLPSVRGSLRVVFLPAGKKVAKLQIVGKIVDGKISITRTAADPAAVGAYAEGRPIFFPTQANRKIARGAVESVR